MSSLFAIGSGCGDVQDDQGARAGQNLQFTQSAAEKSLSRTCAEGQRLRGVDVSYYQGTIDWDRAKATGIDFAFVRISDGMYRKDSQFDRNMREVQRVGLRRGVYQFFRPSQDVNAQADRLINAIGQLQRGDLPPVIDVEDDGGLSQSRLQQKVLQWLNRVESALGVKPIIYTGPYFWRDHVGNPSWAADYPMWIAHYTSGCAYTPLPWSRWTFHQYSDSARVEGISDSVDVDYFNGSIEDLNALTIGYQADSAREASSASGEQSENLSGCQALPPSGGVIEEDGECTELLGPAQYFAADSKGHGGGKLWTTTVSSQQYNAVRTHLNVQRSGLYLLEAYIDEADNNSHQARYQINASGQEKQVIIDQRIGQGFTGLGYFYLRAGADNSLLLGDATGEANSLGRHLNFDAIRLTAEDQVYCRHVRISDEITALNMRAQPNTDLDPIGQLDGGQIVSRLGEVFGQSVFDENNWYEIETDSGVAYISAYFASCAD